MNPSDESTLMKNNLIKWYEETLNIIWELWSNEGMWLCIEKKPMQVEGRFQRLPEKWPFAIREMISSVMPENFHSESHNISMFSMNLINSMPHGMKFHLLPVTNVQQHIKIQAEGLSVSYHKFMHIMCIVNASHRVYETIHVLYISLQI